MTEALQTTTEYAVAPVVMMDQAEARTTIDRIRTGLDDIRRLLLDLEEREGWRALGYTSWRECAAAEFGQSQAYLYRQLAAAKVEKAIDSPIGEMPESHLRPLVGLDGADAQKAAIARADELAGRDKRSARHIAQAAREQKVGQICADCGEKATNKRQIGGILAHRCDACTVKAAAQEQADMIEAGIVEAPSDEMVALCEQAEALGAQINYLAIGDPLLVRVVPPPGFQQRPIDCDIDDMRMLVEAWTRNTAKAKSARPAARDWWACGVEIRAVEDAVKSGDQLEAARAAARLTVWICGDATRLALVQAQAAADLLEQSGQTAIASFLRMLAPEGVTA